MPVKNPSKLQKEAAKRVNRLAPSSADLDNSYSKGFKTFVGDSRGVTDTPRRKIDQARRLGKKTEAEEMRAKADRLRGRR